MIRPKGRGPACVARTPSPACVARTLSPLGIVVVLAVVLAGCNGGGGGGGGNTTAPPSPPTSPPTSVPPTTDAALAAKAKAAVFQQSDFPTGYAPVTEAGEGLDLEIIWGDILKCLGVATAAPDQGSATSPTYLRGLATQGQSTVQYTTAAGAEAVTTALAGPKFADCAKPAMSEDVKRNAPEGATAQPVTEVTSRPVAQRGQKTFAWRIPAKVKLDELEVPLFNDLVVVLDGNALIRYLFLQPGSEFPAELEGQLIDKVVERA